IPQSHTHPFHLRMYHSGVSASSVWSSQIHQGPPHSLLFRHHQYHKTRMSVSLCSYSYMILITCQGLDDRDADDGESSGDDVDNEDEDEEEEEEHLALVDSAIVIPTDKLAAISLPPEAEVERLLGMPTTPPSPLALLSHPLQGSAWLGARLHLHALIDAVTAALPSPPPLYIPPPVDHRDDIPETEMPDIC
nr:hypothetical protein [Tanacetum cinerariifolium]